MGSIISAIYDDYDDYLHLCKQVGETPVELIDGFYDHQRNILQSRGYKSIYDLYQGLHNQKIRDQKIDQIIY
jgi:hypothetical protein